MINDVLGRKSPPYYLIPLRTEFSLGLAGLTGDWLRRGAGWVVDEVLAGRAGYEVLNTRCHFGRALCFWFGGETCWRDSAGIKRLEDSPLEGSISFACIATCHPDSQTSPPQHQPTNLAPKMKLTALLALVPLALACTPGTYQCSAPRDWAVCDVTGTWVTAGSCAEDQYCSMNPINGSPYCIDAPPPDEECSPDLFRCLEEEDGWVIQDCKDGRFETVVRCPEGEMCIYGAVNGYPYCTDDPPFRRV